MTTRDDDPAHASLRTAEKVVALGRAEIKLVLLEARTAATRLAVTGAFAVAAGFFTALAIVVLVFLPVLWAFRPGAALATTGIAVGLALAASVATLLRLRKQRAPRHSDESELAHLAAFEGHRHARER
jgi:uncharacterized membrane protein YqjE